MFVEIIKHKKLLIILLLILFSGLYAQELEPRSYSVIPKNTNVLVAGYSLSNGSIVMDATSPLTDFTVAAHSITPVYMRTFSLLGRLARVSAVVPIVYLSGNVKVNGRDTSGTRFGLADARIKLGINLIGSPAMSLEEFRKFREQTVFGLSLVVSLPIGQYDESKLVNLGSNKWGFKPEIGISYRYEQFYFELFGGVWLFTPNNQFLQTKTLKQDPIYSVQAHVIYIFPIKMWLGVDGTFYYGGRSRVNDVYQNDLMKNSRIGGVFGVPFSMNHSIKLQAHTAIGTYTGSSYSIFSLAYQYIWF